MKLLKNLMICMLVSMLLLSCTSMAHYQQIDAAVNRGDYTGGLALVNAAKETDYKEKDRILFYLDAGLLAHYAGGYTDSSKSLGDAERAIEEAFTKSISLEVSSYLVNDNTKEYPGEDYEDIYLNVFNALNYYHQGSTEGALVEIRRVGNKLKYISTKYGSSITNAQKAMMEKSSDIPYDPDAATVKFSNSALARYLGMLFYRGEGLRDDARIDRNEVKLAFANQPAMYPFPVPSSLENDFEVPKGKARLNILSFNGMAPLKTENTTRIRFGENWIKIALPVITERPSVITRTEVVMSTGETFKLEQIEDMSAVAIETFKQKAALIYLKTVIRSVVKAASATALNAASDQASGGASLGLGLASLATQVYAEASEQADLRLARYYPSKALVGGITLEPGVYSYTVNYYSADDALVHQVKFDNIEIRENKLNLSEAVCIK